MRICGLSIRRPLLSTGTGAVNGVAASPWEPLVRKLGAVEARIARLELVAGASRSPLKGVQSEARDLDTPGLVAWARTVSILSFVCNHWKKQGQSQHKDILTMPHEHSRRNSVAKPCRSSLPNAIIPKAHSHPKSRNLSDRSPHAKRLLEASVVLSTRRQGMDNIRRAEAATQPLSYSI